MKDADDNETANECVKSYSEGQAINLGREARNNLNNLLNLTSLQDNRLRLNDFIEIIKYLIKH